MVSREKGGLPSLGFPLRQGGVNHWEATTAMGPFHVSDEYVIQTIEAWLHQRRVLYVDAHFVNCPGSGPEFLFDSLESWKKLVTFANTDEMNKISGKWVLTVFKDAYPIRGPLSGDVVHRAREEFLEGEDWSFLGHLLFPNDIECVASGDTWKQIEMEIDDYGLSGNKDIFIYAGKDPDFPDHEWIRSPDPNRMTVINYEHHQGWT